MDSYGDLIAADDVLLFVNAAITSTGQREFHSEADEQRLSLDFLHEYMIGNYRGLYAAVLALDINDHNAALIVRRLLETAREADEEQRRTEGRLIARRLALLPPQRVYGLFRELRRAKVNNRRTRAVMRDWIAARPDPAFDAVKYRSGLKLTLRHAHLAPAGEELGPFLFAPKSRARFGTPILESWRRAHYEQAALYELPYTVAEGFAAKHGIARGAFLERIAPRMTRLEQLRLQERARGSRAPAVRADLTRMPLTRLASYVLALPLGRPAGPARRADRGAAHRGGPGGGGAPGAMGAGGGGAGRQLLHRRVGAEAAPAAGGRAGRALPAPGAGRPLHRVVDLRAHRRAAELSVRSDAAGPADPGRAGDRARAPGDRLRRLGQRAARAGRRGAADLAHPARPGAPHQRRPPQPGLRRGRLRRAPLAPTVPTAGLRDAEDLPALVELAQFAEGRTGLAELTAYLDSRTAAFLEGP
ncbi:hypothetical protein P3T34_006611 [Kitasatospora sp. MAP12-44]|nr:hypothetical protein [Kitasatospora sp. MAP12-44]